jgi:hypothetical protein
VTAFALGSGCVFRGEDRGDLRAVPAEPLLGLRPMMHVANAARYRMADISILNGVQRTHRERDLG